MTMRLRAVTITGADDATAPAELVCLWREFPWVEWGILLSAKAKPRPRYPSPAWIDSLQQTAPKEMRVSGHVCGAWARKICRGSFPPEVDRPLFSRMQLNIATFLDEVRQPEALCRCLPPGREFILQVGLPVDEGVRLARELLHGGVNASVLFDASRGRGLSPETWPAPLENVACGFAGGLGPDNLWEQLGRLNVLVREAVTWIDMESKVRTDDGWALDLEKVRQCLELSAKYAGAFAQPSVAADGGRTSACHFVSHKRMDSFPQDDG